MISERKKNLLIVTDWFAPGYKGGGPIKSTVNIAFALKDVYNIKVLTTDTDHGETHPYEGIKANCWINNLDEDIDTCYLKKSSLTLRQLRKRILDSNPDFIYLNHVWSPYFVLYPLWLKYIGVIRAKVILCPRGGLYDSAIKVKAYKKWPILALMNFLGIEKRILFHATNKRESDAINRFFQGSKIFIADNLPSSIQLSFAKLKKVRGYIKCIFVARIVAIKNLLYLLEVLSEIKNEISLTIIGPIEDDEYWNICKQKIAVLPLNISVEYLGPKPSEEIIPLIHSHHLYVSPTEGENFGHSIFEAFLAGRPVLISDQTPWTGLSQKGIGWDLPLDDMEQFVTAIEVAANWDQAGFDEVSGTSWKFANQYLLNSKAISQYHELFK